MNKTTLIPSTFTLVILVFIFRLLNAFLVTTYLFADEWWQFNEVAHLTVFGYGYLTWDWRAGIRSYVFLLPMMAVMWVGKISGSDAFEDWTVKHGGKIIMAGLMCATDIFTMKLSKKYFQSTEISYLALMFSLMSSFHWSRSTRTLSNNVEMALSLVALYFWPLNATDFLQDGKRRFYAAMSLIGIASLIRITTIQFWIFPLLFTFIALGNNLKLRVSFVLSAAAVALLTVLFGVAVDSYFYGKFTVSWWNFFYWNVLRKVSELYGRESVFYHLKTTFPLMMNTLSPYLLVGMWRVRYDFRRAFALIVAAGYTLFNSLVTHKESRFLAPIHPILLMYCAYGAQQMNALTHKYNKYVQFIVKLGLIGVVLSQIPQGWFYSRVHYNGNVEIVDKLRELIDKHPGPKEEIKVFTMMQCHANPHFGYLHRNIGALDFIKCHTDMVKELMPEAERDMNKQSQYRLSDHTHIIMYEYDFVNYHQNFGNYFEECARANNSILPMGKNRIRGDLLILCRRRSG